MPDESLTAEHRFASYGTLAPGRVNHHQMAEIEGRWITGKVHGRFYEKGWGTGHGFPGLVLDQQADLVEVSILISPDLPQHWDRLDTFEGPDYNRTVVQAETDEGMMDVSIYGVEAHD